MIVQDVIDIARMTSLTNLQVGRDEEVIAKLVNLGVSELYRRFNMSIRVETVITNPNLALYELRNNDVSLILNVYNSDHRELRQTDVIDGTRDIKIINYRSFLLENPRNDLLFAVYKASAPRLISLDDEIDIPDSMIDALLAYIAYLGHSTINKDNTNESTAYYRRFDDACTSLDYQGYRISLNTETIDMTLRGYR